MKRYYFDYAAGTPLDPRVEKAMRPYWSEKYGNPGALHWFGQEASAAVFKARDTIAKSLGCNYREIIFTSSATEANNLALRGVLKGIRNKELGIRNKENLIIHNSKFIIPKIIVSSIEHDSILETARDLSTQGIECSAEHKKNFLCSGLEREGVEVVYLPVSKEGIVDLKKLKNALDERTILVSVMYANNEVGTIQPIAKIAEIISNFRKESGIRNQESGANLKSIIPNSSFQIPLFHTDAVQAFNYLNCNVNDLGVDLLTLSAQKIYGPKGAGALYVRRIMNQESGIKNQKRNTLIHNSSFIIHPIITGGKSQEYGLRGGTENVPAIVGFGKAVELVSNSRELENKRLRKLQEYFLKQMKKSVPKAELNGLAVGDQRNSNNLNFYFSGNAAQDLLIKLDLAGFAVSSGAACTARTCQPSHVLKAMGYSDEWATSSIRITFGRPTTKEEVDRLLGAITKIFAGVL